MMGVIRNMRERPLLYLMALPAVMYLILFKVIPSAGMIIAWQDYSVFRGVWQSDFVGWANFERMVNYSEFPSILRNTIVIAALRLAFMFPAPIILALVLNEVMAPSFKRTVQTITYFPHFLSWVIVSQIFINLLSPSGGMVNVLLENVLGVEPINFTIKTWFFRPLVVITLLWKDTGFASIIFLAALAGIDPSLYEAASIDGASRWQQLRRITLPSLVPTMVVVLLLDIGRFMDIGFDQIWTLSNPVVWSVADIFDTYVYRRGLLEGAYSLTTAVNIFKSMVGLFLLLVADWGARKSLGEGLLK